jgi:hypothetical protein
MRLSITPVGHLRMLESTFISILMLIGLLWWFDFEANALKVCGGFMVLNLLPVAYLHTEYYLANKAMIVEVFEDGISVIWEEKYSVYLSKDIIRIAVFMTPSTYVNSNMHLFAMGAYHHAKVYLQSGKIIVITSLMTSDIMTALSPLNGVQIDKRRALFPSILE